MERRFDPNPELERLARRQHGVISHGQLLGLGAPAKAATRWKRGWVLLGPGLYCLADPTWESWCWAGVLHAGPDGVVGGLAAAHLHSLIPDPPRQITLWTTRPGRMGQLGDRLSTVTFRRAFRPGRGELPRTGVEDTVLDAAREADEDQLVALTARALAQRLTTPGRLLAGMGERQRMSQRRILTALCGEAATGVESVLEWRFLVEVVRGHGLPEPVRQPTLVDHTRSDCWWHAQGVVVELDGERWHREAFRDMHKDNRLALTGAMHLHYGWFDVTRHPCEVARQIHQALTRQGYGGPLGSCPRCRERR